MECELLGPDNLEKCAIAASMSYGKDLGGMTRPERDRYVERIWDKHTNVSEHCTKTLLFYNIPRYATLLLAFQRDGFTMTEMSQRRREVKGHSPDRDLYRELLSNGEKFENARRVLCSDVPSECVVTMNREAARSIISLFNKYSQIPFFRSELESLGMQEKLAELFLLHPYATVDNVVPVFLQPTTVIPCELPGGFNVCADQDNISVVGFLPLFSFHQFIRHRKILLENWGVVSEGPICSVSALSNSSMIRFYCKSLHWHQFIATRRGAATQEPLRSFAISLGGQFQ